MQDAAWPTLYLSTTTTKHYALTYEEMDYLCFYGCAPVASVRSPQYHAVSEREASSGGSK